MVNPWRIHSNLTFSDIIWLLSSMPSFIQSIGAILPMFLVLAFMYSVCMTIKSLVLEKELRLKEVLRAVGVRNGALWSARFTENIVLLTVPCALISVMVKVSRTGFLNWKYQNTKHKIWRFSMQLFQGTSNRKFRIIMFPTHKSHTGHSGQRAVNALCFGSFSLLIRSN